MKHIICIGLFFYTTVASAQSKQSAYETRIFKNTVKTLLAYNASQEQSLPIMQLGTGEELIFEFDELGRSNANYFYAVEHCTSDWKPSGISRLDYLEGFSSERLNDLKLSSNTIQSYTHYSLKLPNSQTKIKISGNYVLKVFESGKENNPILTQRFYVVSNQASLKVDILPSAQVNQRNSHQRVDITLQHAFTIANPNMDVKTVVMQNFDNSTSKTFNRPNSVRNGAIIYSDLKLNDFPGGAEFRKFDIRSLRFKGVNVQDIQRSNENEVYLSTNDALSTLRYTSQLDENGNFFIRNNDGRDPKIDADYARVFFKLKANPPSENGTAYIVGRFNNFRISPENAMIYSPDQKAFLGTLHFKQGVYDYKYIWVEDNIAGQSQFEGNFYETENAYQVFIYFKKPGARWEELIAFANVSTAKSIK